MKCRVGAARGALLALAFALLGGCESARGLGRSVHGWLGAEPPPRAHYVGVAGAKLHREPDAASDVVGTLRLHEGVLAYRAENGFAWVRAESDGREGWVSARALIDELPRAREPARAQPRPQSRTEMQPVEPEPESPAEAPAPEREQPPEKSVFDPF
jgi:hypothetical protein